MQARKALLRRQDFQKKKKWTNFQTKFWMIKKVDKLCVISCKTSWPTDWIHFMLGANSILNQRNLKMLQVFKALFVSYL